MYNHIKKIIILFLIFEAINFVSFGRSTFLPNLTTNASANGNISKAYVSTPKIDVIKTQQSFTKYSNLKNTNTITVSDMDKIIDFWDESITGGTRFKNKGYIFINASNATGLDPVYLLSHAAVESGWGRSTISSEKHNYFGINAIDSDPNKAYKMGLTFDEGIIKGSIWINKNFYNDGRESLHDMIYKGKAYASAKDKWINDIVSIYNTSYNIIK